MFKRFFAFFRGWSSKKTFLYLLVLFLSATYVFCIFSFSARHLLNYISIFIAAALVCSIFIYTLCYSRFQVDSFFVLLVVFCFSIILSTAINGGLSSLSKTIFLLSPLSFFLYQFLKDKENIRWFLISVFLGGLLFAIYYFLHYRQSIVSLSFLFSSQRLGDFFDNQNDIARDFVFLALLSAYFSFSNKHSWWFHFFVLFFFFLSLTTGSISNLLSGLAAYVIMLFSRISRGKRPLAFLGLAVLFALLIIVIQIPAFAYFKKRIDGILTTLFSRGENIGDYSTFGRLEYALDGFFLFATRPLFGYGPGGVISYSSGGYSHNNFAELLANYGLFPCVCFEAILLLPLFRGKKNDSFLIPLVYGLVFYLFFFQLFLVTYYTKLDYLCFPILYAATGPVSRVEISFSGAGRNKRVSLRRRFVLENEINVSSIIKETSISI